MVFTLSSLIIKVLWFLLGYNMFLYFHEQAHKQIYSLAYAEPKFRWYFPLTFSYYPTKRVKKLSSTMELQVWAEIIGYHLAGSLIFLLCILLIVFT